MGTLEGKTAIVTGSGRGIGKTIAIKLAKEGANVVVNDIDNAPAMKTVSVLHDMGASSIAVNGNVTDHDFGHRIVTETIKSFGGIDIIINNAGYIWNTTIQNTTEEQWEAMLTVHATAPFRILRSALPEIRKLATAEKDTFGAANNRKVVNISSVSGVYGAATQSAYAAGKMAIVGLTNSLAKEWGRYNVNVNAVAFGYIETRLTKTFDNIPATIDIQGQKYKVGFSKDMASQIAQSTSLGRAGKPEDASGAVYLLCLPESNYITGQTLICDGGRL